MKRIYLFYLLLLSGTVLFVQCSDDDIEPTVVCFPSELPVDEGKMTITYNSLDQPTDIMFVNEDEPETDYSIKLEYPDSRLTKISYYEGDILSNYKTFEHSGPAVIEHVFYKNGQDEFEEYTRYTYHIKSDRIVARTIQDGAYDFATIDSVAYTYNNEGNIVRADYYDDNFEYVYKAVVTYDDKLNPYYISGLNDGDNEFFTMINLSRNNATKIEYIAPTWTEEETITFTYDDEGKPVTRKRSLELDARNIVWFCE